VESAKSLSKQASTDSEERLIFFFAVTLQQLSPSCFSTSIRSPQEVFTLQVKVRPPSV